MALPAIPSRFLPSSNKEEIKIKYKKEKVNENDEAVLPTMPTRFLPSSDKEEVQPKMKKKKVKKIRNRSCNQNL